MIIGVNCKGHASVVSHISGGGRNLIDAILAIGQLHGERHCTINGTENGRNRPCIRICVTNIFVSQQIHDFEGGDTASDFQLSFRINLIYNHGSCVVGVVQRKIEMLIRISNDHIEVLDHNAVVPRADLMYNKGAICQLLGDNRAVAPYDIAIFIGNTMVISTGIAGQYSLVVRACTLQVNLELGTFFGNDEVVGVIAVGSKLFQRNRSGHHILIQDILVCSERVVQLGGLAVLVQGINRLVKHITIRSCGFFQIIAGANIKLIRDEITFRVYGVRSQKLIVAVKQSVHSANNTCVTSGQAAVAAINLREGYLPLFLDVNNRASVIREGNLFCINLNRIHGIIINPGIVGRCNFADVDGLLTLQGICAIFVNAINTDAISVRHKPTDALCAGLVSIHSKGDISNGMSVLVRLFHADSTILQVVHNSFAVVCISYGFCVYAYGINIFIQHVIRICLQFFEIQRLAATNGILSVGIITIHGNSIQIRSNFGEQVGRQSIGIYAKHNAGHWGIALSYFLNADSAIFQIVDDCISVIYPDSIVSRDHNRIYGTVQLIVRMLNFGFFHIVSFGAIQRPEGGNAKLTCGHRPQFLFACGIRIDSKFNAFQRLIEFVGLLGRDIAFCQVIFDLDGKQLNSFC